MRDTTVTVTSKQGTKSEEGTLRSAHESFDARPGNQTGLSTSIFVRTGRSTLEIDYQRKADHQPVLSSHQPLD